MFYPWNALKVVNVSTVDKTGEKVLYHKLCLILQYYYDYKVSD